MFVTPPTQRLGPQLTAVRHLVNCCSRVYIKPPCEAYFIYTIFFVIQFHHQQRCCRKNNKKRACFSSSTKESN